jgi:hypothetical protein
MQVYLYKEEARVFTFTIPVSESVDFLTVKASAYRGSAHDFELRVQAPSKEDPEVAVEQRGVPAWKKGQVVRLSEANFEKAWCKGCQIKILLDVQDEGYYHIMAKTSDSVPLLSNGDQIDDLVTYDQVQCYRYYVSSPSTQVQFQLTTFSGKV